MELAREEAFERLKGELDRPPFNRWIAPKPVEVDVERRQIAVALAFRPEFSHAAAKAVFHGGVLASLIDIVGHATVAVWHGSMTPTIALHIDYIAPADGLELQARGVLRRLGRSVSRADVEVTVMGRLVALGRGTFSTAARHSS